MLLNPYLKKKPFASNANEAYAVRDKFNAVIVNCALINNLILVIIGSIPTFSLLASIEIDSPNLARQTRSS